MGMFKIGGRFESLQDYAEYPYNKLYWHGTLIGKAITDNWQFRKIKAGIESGYLRRAELADGYHAYDVDVSIEPVGWDGESKLHISPQIVIARSEEEVKKRVVQKYRRKYGFTDADGVIRCEIKE